MKRRNRTLVAAIPAATVAMVSTMTIAAEPTESQSSSARLEEVLVTARKTQESVQDVPVSVTAFSAEDLVQNAVVRIQDVRVPGLFVSSNNQGGAPTFAIRAAKADNGTSDTVTAYVGDVPVTTTYAISRMTYDMQSISVLKGPQGTLFGANSTGGAIIFTPNGPSDSFEGYADVGYGNFNRKSFQGMINVPVNNTLQVRLAGELVDRDEGYATNHTPTNNNREIGTEKYESARLSVRVKPTDAWDNNFIFNYFNEDDQPQPEIPVALRDRYNYTTFLRRFINPSNPAAGTTPFVVPVDYALAGGHIVGDSENVSYGGNQTGTFRKAELWDASYVVSYDFSDRLTFKNVLAYQHTDLDYSIDNDTTRFGGVAGRTAQLIKQWTIEPSIDWKSSSGRFRNKLGLFYSDKDWTFGNSYTVVGLPWDLNDPSVTGALIPLGPTPASWVPGNAAIPLVYPITTHSWYDRQLESRAIYNQLSYDITDTLTTTLGWRYTWDEGTYLGQERTTLGAAFAPTQGEFFTGNCGTGNLTYPTYDPSNCAGGAKYKTSAPSWTFTIENRYSDSSLLYATVRGGYLVGGFNNNAQPRLTGIDYTFEPEKVTDFETGIKSDWELAGRPIRTNVAGFYGNYKKQQRVQNGTTAQGVTFIGTVNAGASTFYGLDLDVTYKPFDSLALQLAWNHIESEYTKFDAILSIPGTFAFIDLEGQEMSQTPKDTVNASATFTWPTSPGAGRLSSTLSFFWVASTFFRDSPAFSCTPDPSGECTGPNDPATDFRAFDELPSYALWNFTTEWKGILGSALDARVWVKNLTDKENALNSGNQMLQFGYASLIYGAPREYGINLRYNF